MKKSEYEQIKKDIQEHLFTFEFNSITENIIDTECDRAIQSNILYSILLSYVNKTDEDIQNPEFKTTTERGVWIREKILITIIEYIQINGYPPTVREICDRVGLASTSSVYTHLQKMDSLGMIELGDAASPRALRVPGYKFVKENNDDSKRVSEISNENK